MKKMKFKEILARSFTPEEMEFLHSYLDSIRPPHITVDMVDIRRPSLPSESETAGWVKPCYDLRCVAFAAPLMIERAEEAEKEGYDAVIFFCVWDPGIWSAKAALNIPVIGETESMFRVASLLADRWGLITGISPMKAILRKEIQAYNVGQNIVSVKSLDFDPYLEFKSKKAELEERYIKLGKELISEGAELLITNCGPLFPSLGREALKRIREELGVVILDPQETALRMAEMLVNLGVSQSKITYPLAEYNF